MPSTSLGLGGKGPRYFTGSLFRAGSMLGAQMAILFGLEKEEQECMSSKANGSPSFEPGIPHFPFGTKVFHGAPTRPPPAESH